MPINTQFASISTINNSHNQDVLFADFFKTYEMLKTKPEQIEFCLDYIVDKLKNNSMSAMVGAGFSKNADIKRSKRAYGHPDWAELLVNAYKFLNPDETDKAKIKERIKSIGESEVAAMYEKRNGSRESLDLYIESQLKKLRKKDDSIELHKKMLSIPWDDVITTNWDTLLEDAVLENSSNLFYQTVTTAKQLRMKKPRIIKVNGSLRTKKEIRKNEYSFDDSSDYLYVITPKDFSEYSQKHEGFSNFMKGKFLENSFCLFGFSGADLNFKYWVSELKRTMQKGGKIEYPNPIFLFSIPYDENKDLEKITNKKERKEKERLLQEQKTARELFYEHNYIVPIDLKEAVDYINIKKSSSGSSVTKVLGGMGSSGSGGTTDIKPEELFDVLFDYLLTQTKKGRLESITTIEEKNCVRDIAISGNNIITSNEQAIYLETFQFDNRNLFFTDMFLSKLYSFGREIGQWNTTTFCFIYFWCKNNFLYLSNIFPKDVIFEIIKKYDFLLQSSEQKVEDSRFYGFAQLVLKFLRENETDSAFDDACKVYEKIPKLKNIVYYERACFYVDRFEYLKLNDLLNEWLPENDEIPSSLFIMRKISMLNQFENLISDDDKNEKIKSLFSKAISCAEKVEGDSQYLYFILCSYRYFLMNTRDYEKGNELKYKMAELKKQNLRAPYEYIKEFISVEKRQKIAPNEDSRYQSSEPFFSFNEDNSQYFARLRVFNFFEYTGILPKSVISDKELIDLLPFISKAPRYLLRLFIMSIQFFGESSTEDFMRTILPKILAFLSEDIPNYIDKFKKDLYKSFIEIFEYRNTTNRNIRVWVYLISELIKYLSDEIKQEWAEYFFNLLKKSIEDNNENNAIVDGVRAGHIYGLGKPFRQFLNYIQGTDKLEYLLCWIIREYVDDEREIMKLNGYSVSEFWNYFFDIIVSEDNKDIVRKAFERKEIKLLVQEEFQYKKRLALYAFEYVDDDTKKAVVDFYEKNYSLQTDPYFITVFGNEKIKDRVLAVINTFNIYQRSSMDYSVLTFVKALNQKKLLSQTDKETITRIIFERYKLLENDKKFFKEYNLAYKNSLIETFFFSFSEVYDVMEHNKEITKQYNKLIKAYKESVSTLFDFDWIYQEDLNVFKTNFIKLLSAASYLHEEEQFLSKINMALTKIVFQDSPEFEAVLEQILNVLEGGYGDRILENENTISILAQIKEKFRKKIPICYDVPFITKQMEVMDKIIKRFNNKIDTNKSMQNENGGL